MSVVGKKISSWEDFEKVAHEQIADVANLKATYRERMLNRKPDELIAHPDLPLFRGQSDATWELKTTLERSSGKRKISVYRYYRALHRIKPALESFTGKKWILEDEEMMLEQDVIYRLASYEFLVYLRQYGFPSPLLDWTRSPYVAAFFAYYTCADNDVAIYSYIRGYNQSGRILAAGESESNRGGPYVRSTPRHFLQQSDYTFCTEKNDGHWEFVSAEEVFSKSSNAKNDLMIKYILPGSIKGEVLSRLDAMNINAYSLFSTTEGLMFDLFRRETFLL